GRGAEADLRLNAAVVRVEHVALPGGRREGAAADEMIDCAHGILCGDNVVAPPLAKPRMKCQLRHHATGEAAMKLASLKGGRDGGLVVVSRDLAWCAEATHIAPTLQAALDDWEHVAPQLELLSTDLAHEAIPMMRFHERNAAAPLPRAFQWADGSAYVNHVKL